MKTTAIILQQYPINYPEENNVKIIEMKLPKCMPNGIKVRLLYLSVDPYMRNRLRPQGTKYISALPIGKPIVSMGIAEVVESQSEIFNVGDLITGMLPWQTLAVLGEKEVKRIPKTDLPLTAHLGLLGYPGFTAYIGICHLARLKPQHTVFVSAAAGAVGSIAGQLAKIAGCHVVGMKRTQEKVNYLLNEAGFDAAFNYTKYAKDYLMALQHYCPQGIDINFENVGGPILQAVIEWLNPQGQIILCGAISHYNHEPLPKGPVNIQKLCTKNAKMTGYIVTDFPHLFTEFQQTMLDHYLQGKITYRETIVVGLTQAWQAFIDLFSGINIGKMLIEI